VSGGFAVMNPDSTLNISALEAFPLDQLDGDAARKAVSETTSRIASATNEQEKASLKAELEVYEAVATATK
jgi:F-type H+-transporting ATPase subunit delta